MIESTTPVKSAARLNPSVTRMKGRPMRISRPDPQRDSE